MPVVNLLQGLLKVTRCQSLVVNVVSHACMFDSFGSDAREKHCCLTLTLTVTLIKPTHKWLHWSRPDDAILFCKQLLHLLRIFCAESRAIFLRFHVDLDIMPLAGFMVWVIHNHLPRLQKYLSSSLCSLGGQPVTACSTVLIIILHLSGFMYSPIFAAFLFFNTNRKP